MDPKGRIYKDEAENIPPEDAARLEGFLEAQAQVTEMHRLKDCIAEMEAPAQDSLEITVTWTQDEATIVREACDSAPHIRWDETLNTAMAKLTYAERSARFTKGDA